MGGHGSGRSGGRPTVEDSLTLDLRRLFKDGRLKVGAGTYGTLRWTRVGRGEEIASMGFQSALGEESGYVQLHWTSTNRRTGETRQCEDRITLTTRPQPFGGRRWFFVCPRTGESATKLYLPSGAYTFASRKAYRLDYRSQRESPRDRSLSRAFALRRKIGGEGGICSSIEKQKGMHRRTFETRDGENLRGRGDRRGALRSAARSAKRKPSIGPRVFQPAVEVLQRAETA